MHEKLDDFDRWSDFANYYHIRPSLCLYSSGKSGLVHALTMSSATNGTSSLLDAWSGYVAYAQAQLTLQNTKLALLSMLTIPVLAVVLNVLSQVVSGFSSF